MCDVAGTSCQAVASSKLEKHRRPRRAFSASKHPLLHGMEAQAKTSQEGLIL